MSYGPNFPDQFRRAAELVDKILRGAKPSDLPVEHQSDIGAESIRAAVVPYDRSVRRVRIEPPHRIGLGLAVGDFWGACEGEIFRGDDRPSLKGSIADLQAEPLRHVFDRRVDRAGPTPTVGYPVGEWNLDTTLWRIPVTLRVIGSGLDGGTRAGRMSHAERIENLALHDRAPVGCALR